jgi:hypothetical protein
MTFWFTVMLLIVGSGDDTGKSRRYKTGSLEPAYSFFHMSLSTGSTLVGLFGRIPLDESSARRIDLYLTTQQSQEKDLWHRWDSNPQYQQASGLTPTP